MEGPHAHCWCWSRDLPIFTFLLQMAPDSEEDACKVKEGGRFGLRDFGKEHKRKKTTAPPCQRPESCHGESNTFNLGFLQSSFLFPSILLFISPNPPVQRLLLQVGRVGGAHLPTFPRTFNGSENDLTLAYNSSLSRPLPGGRVRYNPDGRTSPEVCVVASFSES